MRTAVLITGQERSLPRIIRLLRKNLLEPNNVTVFFACESNDKERLLGYFDGITIGGADIRPTFRDTEFGTISTMVWSSCRPALQDRVFARSNEGWSVRYVFDSGTLLQYYQLWKAWGLVLEYEKQHGKFDIVVRCRPDFLLTERLNLSTVMSSDELTCRSLGSQRIKDRLTLKGGSTENAVITLGTEQFWVARRDVFALFGPMVYMFGVWDSGTTYAFNSECFFSQFCEMNHLTHWIYSEGNIFNTNHPGTDEVLDDPLVFSLLR